MIFKNNRFFVGYVEEFWRQGPYDDKVFLFFIGALLGFLGFMILPITIAILFGVELVGRVIDNDDIPNFVIPFAGMLALLALIAGFLVMSVWLPYLLVPTIAIVGVGGGLVGMFLVPYYLIKASRKKKRVDDVE